MDTIISKIKSLRLIVEHFLQIFNEPLFHLGTSQVTLGSILYFILSIVLLIFISGLIKRILINRVFTRSKLDIGISQSIATIIRYIILILGISMIIQSQGIDLSALGLLAGALGVGIGFGLQNITNNFISGVIILFERPIKIGDSIEIGNTKGEVVKIAPRATTLITGDNSAIIVPNSDFISSKIINWSYHDRTVGINVPVQVAYKEDPNAVTELLLQIAGEQNGILKKPAPMVLFEAMAENGLIFNLKVWTTEFNNRPGLLKSNLNYEIFNKLKENNIEIPYPQRYLHIKLDEIS